MCGICKLIVHLVACHPFGSMEHWAAGPASLSTNKEKWPPYRRPPRRRPYDYTLFTGNQRLPIGNRGNDVDASLIASLFDCLVQRGSRLLRGRGEQHPREDRTADDILLQKNHRRTAIISMRQLRPRPPSLSNQHTEHTAHTRLRQRRLSAPELSAICVRSPPCPGHRSPHPLGSLARAPQPPTGSQHGPSSL